jgi:hypothetical protein
VMYAEQGACVRRRSWAGYTINMLEFEFPTGTGQHALPRMTAITWPLALLIGFGLPNRDPRDFPLALPSINKYW